MSWIALILMLGLCAGILWAVLGAPDAFDQADREMDEMPYHPFGAGEES